MSESFSIKWNNIYINVLICNDVIQSLTFSKTPTPNTGCSEIYKSLKKDLANYISGKKVDFSIYNVRFPKSRFYKKVLKVVRNIPYGKTITYKDLANIVSSSPRAVGQALKANFTPIIIPCHRVISKNGIGGFSWGLEIKRKLLELEGVKLD